MSLRELPERREAVEDRREYPGSGYGQRAQLDPSNERIEQRRDWRRRNMPRYPKLTDPMHPDDEAEVVGFLGGFNPKEG